MKTLLFVVLFSSISSAQIGANMPFVIDQYMGSAHGSDMTPAFQKTVQAMGQKSIRDAKYSGMKLVRTTSGSWGPVFFDTTGPNSYRLWQEDPSRFWSLSDAMMNDFAANGISLAVSLVFTIETFPSLNHESVRDLIINAKSKSALMQKKYIQEYVARYKDHPAIKIWELHNELNLFSDIDMEHFCLEQRKDSIKTPQDKITYCGSAGNFTTAEMITYSQRVVNEIRAVDKTHKITAGYAISRVSAEHLRKSPQFSGHPDWTKDSFEEFLKITRDINAPFDIISMHIYSGDDIVHANRPYVLSKDPNNTEFIEWCNLAAQKIGKPLFIGEFFDAAGTDKGYPFTLAAVKKIAELKIPFSTLWVWEFYQFSTYQHQNIGAGEVALEPGYSDDLIFLVREMNQQLGHKVYQTPKEDRTPPELIISWPIEGSFASFVNVLSTDNSLHPPEVDIYLNNEFVGTMNKAPYKMDLPKLTPGSYKLLAIAKDSDGNISKQNIQLEVK